MIEENNNLEVEQIIVEDIDKEAIYDFLNEQKRNISNKTFKLKALKVLQVLAKYNQNVNRQTIILEEFEKFGIEFSKEESQLLFESNEKYLVDIIKQNRKTQTKLLDGLNQLL